jgi:hypothetical protein
MVRQVSDRTLVIVEDWLRLSAVPPGPHGLGIGTTLTLLHGSIEHQNLNRLWSDVDG